MGNTSSTTSVLQKVTSDTVMNIMTKNVTSCQVDNSVLQRIKVVAGDGSMIVASDINMNAQLTSQFLCLMQAQLNSSDIAQMKNQLAADLNQNTIKFPDLQKKTSKNTTIQQEWVTTMTSNIDFQSILQTVQKSSIDQGIDLKAGNNSTIVLNQVQMTGTMVLLSKTISDQVSNILRNFDQANSGGATSTATDTNALQPLADTVDNAVNQAANVANTGISSGTNFAMLGTITFAIVVITVIIAIVIALKNPAVTELIKSILPTTYIDKGKGLFTPRARPGIKPVAAIPATTPIPAA